jgi:predicted NAD-dependent protein-ADP-ribosyltransferase YbiA (DUF1768 family)
LPGVNELLPKFGVLFTHLFELPQQVRYASSVCHFRKHLCPNSKQHIPSDASRCDDRGNNHSFPLKMTTICEDIVKSTGAMCTRPAIYLIDGRELCGIHTPKLLRRPGNLIVPLGTPAPSKAMAAVARAETRVVEEDEPSLYDKATPMFGLLLNTALTPITIVGIDFKSVTAAYNAMRYYYKHSDPKINEALYNRVGQIARDPDAGIVLGLPIRPDWHNKDGEYEVHELIMFDILEVKFKTNAEARQALKETKGFEITGPGITPRLLMLVRMKLFGF